jgi:dTDP-4-amino-4,6-dideoxygalactose transaminase
MSNIQQSPAMPPIRVPYVNLVDQHAQLRTELLNSVGEVIDSGQFVLGPWVEKFEKQFAELCNVRYAVSVGNGTDALVLALRVAGVGVGDEVITVPNTFIATASAIILAGARPVFVDVGDDYNIDPDKISAAITPRTRAILPVHLTGRAARMEKLTAIAARHNLVVIEDAAQSVMAERGGRRVGSLGALGCFSLHPLKTLNACGDGGVITTNIEEFSNRLRIMRNIGLATRENATEWSGNSRLDSIQAAILLVKLRYLAKYTNARRENAAQYRRLLGGIDGIRMPIEEPDERPVYHTFVIRAKRRDELKSFLRSHGIESGIHYPIPIYLQTAAAGLRLEKGSFPVTELQASEILSLPIYPELTLDQIQLVANVIREFYK